MPQWRLALRLGLRPSTLSDYLRGARPAPEDLGGRIERALNLGAGTLDSGENRGGKGKARTGKKRRS